MPGKRELLEILKGKVLLEEEWVAALFLGGKIKNYFLSRNQLVFLNLVLSFRKKYI